MQKTNCWFRFQRTTYHYWMCIFDFFPGRRFQQMEDSKVKVEKKSRYVCRCLSFFPVEIHSTGHLSVGLLPLFPLGFSRPGSFFFRGFDCYFLPDFKPARAPLCRSVDPGHAGEAQEREPSQRLDPRAPWESHARFKGNTA